MEDDFLGYYCYSLVLIKIQDNEPIRLGEKNENVIKNDVDNKSDKIHAYSPKSFNFMYGEKFFVVSQIKFMCVRKNQSISHAKEFFFNVTIICYKKVFYPYLLITVKHCHLLAIFIKSGNTKQKIKTEVLIIKKSDKSHIG